MCLLFRRSIRPARTPETIGRINIVLPGFIVASRPADFTLVWEYEVSLNGSWRSVLLSKLLVDPQKRAVVEFKLVLPYRCG